MLHRLHFKQSSIVQQRRHTQHGNNGEKNDISNVYEIIDTKLRKEYPAGCCAHPFH